ncbi:MAG: hypothetical protein IT461_02650 [Planctomycetes bacterium]|jgi:hypothetical protein|nr:hypothetical protein [Planctomycetota bacterium]
MANFRIMVKGEWKGPFPETALTKKYNEGGIPLGTRVQDVATGGTMAIEELAAGATLVLDQSAKGPAKPKLSPAERNAPTQKISKPAPQKPASAPAKPEAAKPAIVLPKKDSARLPAAKLPRGSATRKALALPEKKSRGLNGLAVLGSLVTLGGFGAPWFLFEGAGAEGGDLLFFGWNLAHFMTVDTAKLGAAPPAELFFAANMLWLLGLVPLAALVVLLDEFISAAKGRNRWWLRLLAALCAPGVVAGGAFLLFSGMQSGVGASVLPAGATYVEFLQASFERLQGHIQPGIYAFAAGPVILLLSVLTSPKRKASEATLPLPKAAVDEAD